MKLIDNLIKKRKAKHLRDVKAAFYKSTERDIDIAQVFGRNPQTSGAHRQTNIGRIQNTLHTKNEHVLKRKAYRDLLADTNYKLKDQTLSADRRAELLKDAKRYNNLSESDYEVTLNRDRVKDQIHAIRSEVDARWGKDKRNMKIAGGTIATLGVTAAGHAAYTRRKAKKPEQ